VILTEIVFHFENKFGFDSLKDKGRGKMGSIPKDTVKHFWDACFNKD
jgi:hypothetical protein